MEKEIKVNGLDISSQLSGNPKGNPKFFVKHQLKTGQCICFPDPDATRSLIALMDMEAHLGGAASHYGGPAAFAEILSAFFGVLFDWAIKTNQQWHELVHFVNDAGHCENGLYAIKANYEQHIKLEDLKKFRSLESPLTGHGEVPLFPEGVLVSNGPLGSSLPVAEGLCFGDRLTCHTRVTVCAISDGGCMEGEARECLASIPGLAEKGKLNPFMLIISDNNTKLSGRISEQSFSMNPTFESLNTLGWRVIKVENGNQLKSCIQAIEEGFDWMLKNPRQPVCLWVKTIKGFGTQASVESSSGAHGFHLNHPNELDDFLKELYGEKEIPNEFIQWTNQLKQKAQQKESLSVSTPLSSYKIQDGVSQALIDKKKEGHPLISVTSDLSGSTGLGAFCKQFPESTIDMGVAEANMISVATGLSKSGYVPVIDTFARFGTTKGALPFIMSSLSRAPMLAIFSHVGFQDAADGASHQSLSYYAMTHSLPGLETYHLTCKDEAYSLIGQAVDRFVYQVKKGRKPQSVVFFLGREKFPSRYTDQGERFELGKAQIVMDTSDVYPESVTLIGTGALLGECVAAGQRLVERNIGVIVINPSAIKNPDIDTISKAINKTRGRLLVVEEHQRKGGFNCLLAGELAQRGLDFKMRVLAVEDHFGRSAYSAKDLYCRYGLDFASIQREVMEMLSC